MKYICIIPTRYIINLAPTDGIPQLLGYIEKNNGNAECIDVNLDIINKLSNKSFLLNITEKYEKLLNKNTIEYENFPYIKSFLDEYRDQLISELSEIKKLSKNLPFCYFVLKNKITFYNPNLFYPLKHKIYKLLILLSSFEVNYLKKNMPDFSNYMTGIINNNFEINLTVLKNYFDSEFNLFSEYYDEYINDILNKKPDCVGISISTGEQILSGLYFCYKIRQKSDIHINVGGHFFNEYYKNISNLNQLFENFFHSISLTEDNIQTIDGFIKYFNNEIEIKDIPQIAYLENNGIRVNDFNKKISQVNLPFRSFEGYKRENYLIPEFILPIKTSTKCYWHKCIFCGCSANGIDFRVRPVENVVDEIEYLSKKYKTKFFYFWDYCIHPNYMKRLSALLIKRKLKIKYSVYARFEKEFTQDLLKQMKKSGCLIIHWGLDSASQRILDYINKGIKVENAEKILEISHKAKIYNFVYFLLEQPTETVEDLEKNVDFVAKNKKIIDVINPVKRLVVLKTSIIGKSYETKYKKELNSVSRENIISCFNKIFYEMSKKDNCNDSIKTSDENLLYVNKYGKRNISKIMKENFIIRNKHFFHIYLKYIQFLFNTRNKFNRLRDIFFYKYF